MGQHAAVRHLETVVPAAPGRVAVGGADNPIRAVTRQIAFGPGGWTPERAAKVAALFDGLAPDWDARFASDPHRLEPVADALERGGPSGAGACLEVGSGTGITTAFLAERFSLVVALDLAWEMLRRSPAEAGPRVQADGAALPVADGRAGAVVLVNAFLFPAEVDRVLAPDGAVVWVNTYGSDTPIHLPADDVEAALPGRWDGVAAEAGWGTWAVLRRAGA